MKLTKKAQAAILRHAKQCYPRECCGLIVKRQYVPCTNIATDDGEFMINPMDVVSAEAIGKIQAIVHSHPDGTSDPSPADRVQIGKHDVPWVIASYPAGDIAVHDKGYHAPLVNREYIHGSLDCYSIVRDYYARELGIELDDFERTDLWWESADSSLYLDNFTSQGFVPVDDLQRHDVILCAVQPTRQVNHALVYLGNDGSLSSEMTEPAIGDHLVLHHPYLRRSRREIYGNVWRERTSIIIRHKSLIKD